MNSATFQSCTVNRKWGLKEGQLPHVRDTIELFNNVWNSGSKQSIMKCWLKSGCLGPIHTRYLCSMLHRLNQHCTDVDIDLTTTNWDALPDFLDQETPIDSDIISMIQLSLNEYRFTENDTSPLITCIVTGIIQEVNQSDLSYVLNSRTEFDKDKSRIDISIEQLRELFENSRMGNNETGSSANQDAEDGQQQGSNIEELRR